MKFTQIKETCLYVKDLNKSIRFYRDQLGLELFSHVEDNHAFFRVGSSVLLCFNPERSKKKNNLPPHYGSGHLHLAFEVITEDYDPWKQKINDLNIPIEHEQVWQDKYRSFYFRDPDQHLLEIVEKGMWEEF